MNKIFIKKTVVEYKSVSDRALCKFTQHYIDIRNNMGGTLTTCFHCEKKPKMDSNIYILFTSKGNKMVCEKCAIEIKENSKGE